MNRRSFLQKGATPATGFLAGASLKNGDRDARSWKDDGKSTPAWSSSVQSSGDLSPYVPRADKPWDEHRAAHLLRRAGFGFSWSDLNTALQSTPTALVDAMLKSSAAPAPPGSWVTQIPPTQITDTDRTQFYTWVRDMQEWWINLMMQPQNALREKMVLFWHNHFVSEYTKVEVTQHLYNQNQLFRQNAFGMFNDLTKKVSVDPAMLIYLDGATSRQGNPNENYARELMELFTLGAGAYKDGTPHYSEKDIVEMAKALTGWTVNGLTGEFKSARFDSGSKTIFGKTGNFGLAPNTTNVIDHIFSQDDKDIVNHKRAAVYICTKLYQFFVSETPDMDIVAGMAQTLVDSYWMIGPVLKQLLTSEHFFDDNVIGAKIKSPADFVLGSMRQFSLTPAFARNNSDVARPETHDPNVAMAFLSQWLLYPPNVKGWLGGRTWISSATVPLRIRYSKMWIEPIPGALPWNFNPVTFVKSLPDSDDAEKLLGHMIALLLPLGISDESKQGLLDELLGGGPAYEWNPDASNAATRIRACLIRMTNLGEYQLM
ncbi:MAG: DUF1800 domain-containing protein [Candidatus Kapaibacterium sp.]